jgi:hypothetical protein
LLVEAQRARAARVLESVLAQSLDGPLEVLLIDAGPAGDAAIPGSDDPRVQVIQPAPTETFGQMLANAACRARAPLIAFLEEHCVALPGWAEALLQADAGDSVIALGGERCDPPPRSRLEVFAHLLDTGPWSAPAVDCAVPGLPEGNVAYRRDGLLRYRDRLAQYFQCEGLLHERMVADGFTLRVVPGARYEHAYETSLRAMCARWYAMGWVAGAARVDITGASRRERVAEITRCLRALTGNPVARLGRVAGRRAGGRRLVLTNLHAGIMWCWMFTLGQLLGTAFGMRRMDVRVQHLVLNSHRQGRS